MGGCMSDYLYDVLTVVGLVAMVAALYLGVGALAALGFIGLALVVAGVTGAWRESR